MMDSIIAHSGSHERSVEVLSEEEEFYVGLVRKVVDCARRGSDSYANLRQIEQVLLVAGATKMRDGEGPESRRFAIRDVCFEILVCRDDRRNFELRFEHNR